MAVEPFDVIESYRRKRKLRKIIIFAVIILGCLISRLHAEEASPNSIDAVIAQALKTNPQVNSAREELKAARSRLPQSWALPDPTFTYSVMGPDLMTRNGPIKDQYEGEQMIPFPGKLLEKHRMAVSEYKAAQAKLKSVERDVAYKVAETLYDLYAVTRTIEVAEEVRDLLLKLESVAESRYASNSAQQREVARAQAEVSDTLQRLFILRQQKDSLSVMLNSLLNRDPATVVDVPSGLSLPPQALQLPQLVTEAEKANRPELLAAKAEQEKQHHARTLARYENTPDISVGFQYYRIGKGDTTEMDDGRDAWMIPVKVSIPLWQNRISSAIQEANSNLRSADSKLREAENATDYETRNAYYRYQSQRQVVDLYQNAFIPQAELAFKSDQAGYEAGKTDILSLVDSERVYLNAKVAYYQAMADVMKNFSAIEKAIGKDLR